MQKPVKAIFRQCSMLGYAIGCSDHVNGNPEDDDSDDDEPSEGEDADDEGADDAKVEQSQQ